MDGPGLGPGRFDSSRLLQPFAIGAPHANERLVGIDDSDGSLTEPVRGGRATKVTHGAFRRNRLDAAKVA
jgi:hypothetical protein